MGKKKRIDFVANIQNSGLSIYDQIDIGDPDLWIPSVELETLLREGLLNLSLKGLANRTRSKVVKSKICELLGYPVPKSFRKTKPRFPGQFFDTYIQKSNNLQVWNEELSASRRYVLIGVSSDFLVSDVRVVTGEALALLDTTGTLTQKYQARFTAGKEPRELFSLTDTDNLARLLSIDDESTFGDTSPADQPKPGEILPVSQVFIRLGRLVGRRFEDKGIDQERNRGAALHKLVCEALGFRSYKDDGNFPDIRNQLVEVKLQTAPTIDLGLVLPSSKESLDISQIEGQKIRHCDVRYAVFGAETNGKEVIITSLVLTTGESFLNRFPQFQGKVLNRKLQIRLPKDFFRIESK